VTERDGDGVGRADDDESVVAAAEAVLIFENAALPLCVILPTGYIAMANRAMRTLLVYDSDELINRPIQDLVVADPDALARVWEEWVTGGGASTNPESRVVLRCGDGTELTVRASSGRVTDSSGAVRYVVAQATPAKG
jgi:PAS domain S-box-containing protein